MLFTVQAFTSLHFKFQIGIHLAVKYEMNLWRISEATYHNHLGETTYGLFYWTKTFMLDVFDKKAVWILNICSVQQGLCLFVICGSCHVSLIHGLTLHKQFSVISVDTTAKSLKAWSCSEKRKEKKSGLS